ncbi:TldD/PmbA family protein [Actinomadura sp. NPDC047616]|uniref:TldD/PmbA family protein n=1 Tax=Actinomadura sp. NPDC047616 TaxID=3155914 RepID=UPI0033E8A5A7
MAAPFDALPLPDLADAALGRAAGLGARHAAVLVTRVRTGTDLLYDGRPAGGHDATDTALGVRVIRDGVQGFASTDDIGTSAAADAAARAVSRARACRAITAVPSDPVDEPVHRDTGWSSPCRVDPFGVPRAERARRLADWSRRLLAHRPVTHVHAKLVAVREEKFYADLAGTVTVQRRVRIHPQVTVLGVGPGTAASLRTAGPPTARGLEYLDGDGWDWDAELAALPGHLAGKLRAPAVEPGERTLVIDPSNLWLTVHESVGHATELDRALGHEAGYAGTTFADPAARGVLRYGAKPMNVTADRTAEHGLATVGYDDEGVAAQAWDLVRDGVLTGFQLDRSTARLAGAERSNGCAYAESARHVPLPRMPNVSLCPAPDGPSTEELISDVTDGLYLVGSGGWSIDTERRTFQFTAQRCHRIRRGRLAGQVRDVAYQADTLAFWNSLCAVGGPADYRLFGADLCGKGQPVQVAAASHGCPPAVFHRVRVVNAAREAGL